jgi:hypothetical protein
MEKKPEHKSLKELHNNLKYEIRRGHTLTEKREEQLKNLIDSIIVSDTVNESYWINFFLCTRSGYDHIIKYILEYVYSNNKYDVNKKSNILSVPFNMALALLSHLGTITMERIFELRNDTDFDLLKELTRLNYGENMENLHDQVISIIMEIEKDPQMEKNPQYEYLNELENNLKYEIRRGHILTEEREEQLKNLIDSIIMSDTVNESYWINFFLRNNSGYTHIIKYILEYVYSKDKYDVNKESDILSVPFTLKKISKFNMALALLSNSITITIERIFELRNDTDFDLLKKLVKLNYGENMEILHQQVDRFKL